MSEQELEKLLANDQEYKETGRSPGQGLVLTSDSIAKMKGEMYVEGSYLIWKIESLQVMLSYLESLQSQ